jgi:hypothetical protein
MTAEIDTTAEPSARASAPMALRSGGSLRPRLLRIAFVVAVLAVASPFLARLPREQALRFEIPPHLRSPDARLQRLEVSWVRVGDEGATGGFTDSFVAGAPPSVRHVLTVPNGELTLDVTLSGVLGGQNAPRPFRDHLARRVSLEGDEIRISLEGSPQ